MNKEVHFSSSSGNWFTPDCIIKATLSVFDSIDLDPCSPNNDGPIPAKYHFTVEDDGLSQCWYGKVYMNPPYGRDIGKWVNKAISEFVSLRVSEAILLLPARTDTKWFNSLAVYPWCAIRGRLKFSGHENSAPFPSAVFYLGNDNLKFIESFWHLGNIWSMCEDAYSWPNVPVREGIVS